ncbi:MAG: PEP-CTERM sorting domain-containing protein [Gammaproteobacteria bacterium]
MPRSNSRSRHARSRRLGALGLLLSSLLTPAGVLMMVVAAAALGGGAWTLLHTTPASRSAVASTAPEATHPAVRGPAPRQAVPLTTQIESDGATLPIVLAEDAPPESPVPGRGSTDHFVSLGLPGTSSADTPRAPTGLPSPPAAKPASAGGDTPPPPGAPVGLAPRVPEQQPARGRVPEPASRTNPPTSTATLPPAPGVSNPPSTTPPGPRLAAALPPEPTVSRAHAVPEPATLGLVALGCAALAWNARRARRDRLPE